MGTFPHGKLGSRHPRDLSGATCEFAPRARANWGSSATCSLALSLPWFPLLCAVPSTVPWPATLPSIARGRSEQNLKSPTPQKPQIQPCPACPAPSCGPTRWPHLPCLQLQPTNEPSAWRGLAHRLSGGSSVGPLTSTLPPALRQHECGSGG